MRVLKDALHGMNFYFTTSTPASANLKWASINIMNEDLQDGFSNDLFLDFTNANGSNPWVFV